MQHPLHLTLSLALLLLVATIPSSSTPLSQQPLSPADLDFLSFYNQTTPSELLPPPLPLPTPASTPVATATRPHITQPPTAQPILIPRGQCAANPCGWSTWLCCGPYATCYTNALTQAACASISAQAAATQAGGYWSYYTTTYCVTETLYTTAVWSTYVAPTTTTSECGCETHTTAAIVTTYVPPATTANAVSCAAGLAACGNICCGTGSTCMAWGGQCGAITTAMTSSAGSYSAPVKATTSTLLTVTVSPTTTVAFQPAVTTGSNATLVESTAASTSLSGGAIAGIVIGVLIAIIVLLALCLIFCFKSLYDTLKNLLGFGGDNRNTRRRRETVEVTEYRRHGSRSSGRRLYERPGRTETVQRKNDNSGPGWGSLAAGLGGLAVLLGMRREKDKGDNRRRRRDEKSEYSGSSGYYDESVSYESSDRRTRDTRRS